MEERVEFVPVDSIKPAWLNLSRHDAEVVEMLVADIRAGGARGIYRIDPILLRRLPPEEAKPPVIYEVIDGHKRLEAAKRLGLPAIRARIIDADREEALELNYRKNKERGEVDEVLESFYFLHLAEDLKMPAYQIAERFGMKESVVASIISRARLTKEARRIIWRDVAAGGKSFTRKHLEVLSSAPPEIQAKLAAMIYERKLSPQEAERAKELLAAGAPEEEAAAQAKKGIKLKEAAQGIVERGRRPPEPKPPEPKLPKPAEAPGAGGGLRAQEAPPPAGKGPAGALAGGPPAKRVEVFKCPRCGIEVEVDWEAKSLRWRG